MCCLLLITILSLILHPVRRYRRSIECSVYNRASHRYICYFPRSSWDVHNAWASSVAVIFTFVDVLRRQNTPSEGATTIRRLRGCNPSLQYIFARGKHSRTSVAHQRTMGRFSTLLSFAVAAGVATVAEAADGGYVQVTSGAASFTQYPGCSQAGMSVLFLVA